MFSILNTLIIMLQGLGISGYLLQLGENVDENLFLASSGLNKFMFVNITYSLFSLLDKDMTDACFNDLIPIENAVQYKTFIERTVRWLKNLSNTFELLRYVPISNTVLQDCSGPVMHQIMLAFTMIVAKYKIFVNKRATLKYGKHTLDSSNFEVYHKIFKIMLKDKDDFNRKKFDANLLEYLLTHNYSEQYRNKALKNGPRPADTEQASVSTSATAQQGESSNEGGDASGSNSLDIAYPLEHKGPRIKIKRPFFMQSSPLNENRVLKPVPPRAAWDLDTSSYFEKEESLYIKLMKRHQCNIKRALRFQRLEEQIEADRRQAREDALIDNVISVARRKLQEQRDAARRKVERQKSEAEKKEKRSAAKKKAQEDKERLIQGIKSGRGKKRKSDEIDESSTSTHRNKRTLI